MIKINNKKLAKFLGYKAIRLLILLIVIAAISFIMVQLSPIDPVKAYLGQRIVSQEQLAIIGEYWGTNLSLAERVVGWLQTLASGSMGFSLIYRVPVTEVIAGNINLYNHCQNVTVSDSCPIGTESPIGNHPKYTEKTIKNTNPIQKVGVDCNM